MLLLLSNLRVILVRGTDGSGWLVSHGCRGLDHPFVGIVLLGFGFLVDHPSKSVVRLFLSTFSSRLGRIVWYMKLMMELNPVFAQYKKLVAS